MDTRKRGEGEGGGGRGGTVYMYFITQTGVVEAAHYVAVDQHWT